MTSIVLQCNFCQRGFSLKWYIPPDGSDTDIGYYICNAYPPPDGVPEKVEMGIGDCEKFITNELMDDDDRDTFEEIYPHLIK